MKSSTATSRNPYPTHCPVCGHQSVAYDERYGNYACHYSDCPSRKPLDVESAAIQRLQTELVKANAELTRLRRQLAEYQAQSGLTAVCQCDPVSA